MSLQPQRRKRRTGAVATVVDLPLSATGSEVGDAAHVAPVRVEAVHGRLHVRRRLVGLAPHLLRGELDGGDRGFSIGAIYRLAAAPDSTV